MFILQQANIPLDAAQLSALVDVLDTDGDGSVDFRELVVGQKDYTLRERKQKLEIQKAQTDTEKLLLPVIKERITSAKSFGPGSSISSVSFDQDDDRHLSRSKSSLLPNMKDNYHSQKMPLVYQESI